MELANKLLDQNAFNTRPKIEEQLLIVMDKSIHEENSAQPLQTKKNSVKSVLLF